ncbi:N-6 DNA methylase [Nocardia sp. KC 131]|uniref:class I SAM-dependent DNA methyltransferase n=1 Tax=Nocardia arseniciresistens TaxID=3392119 RepID=UPI00398EE382
MTTAQFHTDAGQLVAKLWNYCHVLRHDGVSTFDYVDQLTLLLFLKMAQERADRRLGREEIIPEHLSWPTLLDSDAKDLKDHYEDILDELGSRGGALGRIFHNAQNKIRNAATLEKLIVDLIDKEHWSSTGVDIKGDAYESLLEKGAEDAKSGAGQYFTPCALIDAMVDCMQPTPKDTIVDPACGTGGFLLAAHKYIEDNHGDGLSVPEAKHLESGGISGVELMEDTARLAQMNLLVHGIGRASGDALIKLEDALAKTPENRVSLVLANPPFGRKSGFTAVDEIGRITREDVSYKRSDFWVTTTNKQLNFIQHIYTLLAIDGRAAVVLPDNVLFEGGAGEDIRRNLLQHCDVGEDRETREESERFKPFTYDELIARDKLNLDITWLRDPDLEDSEDLQAALAEFAAVAEALQLAKAEREGLIADE